MCPRGTADIAPLLLTMARQRVHDPAAVQWQTVQKIIILIQFVCRHPSPGFLLCTLLAPSELSHDGGHQSGSDMRLPDTVELIWKSNNLNPRVKCHRLERRALYFILHAGV